MNASYATIKNNKGMSAQVIACAYDDDPQEGYGRKRLYSLDIAGSHTAVKAIWASVLSGSPLTPSGFAGYKVLRGDKETKYLAMRSTPLPNINHYHIIVEPMPTATYLVITSQLGINREYALTRMLNTHTLYPVLPDWGDVLFDMGVKAKLVHALETFGLDWAYRVEVLGWETILDSAAKNGLLVFPAV